MRRISGEDDAQGGRAARESRKPYASPRLVRYGDVAHLTRSNPAPGKLKDNPTLAKSRTV
jgi:hypothetical protein